jgi:peptide chain release factor 2
MDESKEQKRVEMENLETEMNSAFFWNDKDRAQYVIKRIQELKNEIEGLGKYDKSNAVITIFSGAGGDDAEDFSSMLFNMYVRFCYKNGLSISIVHQNENDHGGFRNITFEVSGSLNGLGAYGLLKNESGVHRLVRVSPFNANAKRHTSFSMVEVIPEFEKQKGGAFDIEIDEKDLKVEFSRSSGPGGQNVNKRETAVRIVHIPTGLSASSENQRSQAQNKEKAVAILKGKIYKALEDERVKKEAGMYISKTTQIEWGNQIRSYVLHPYHLVKDHRSGYESTDPEGVLEGNFLPLSEAYLRWLKK